MADHRSGEDEKEVLEKTEKEKQGESCLHQCVKVCLVGIYRDEKGTNPRFKLQRVERRSLACFIL